MSEAPTSVDTCCNYVYDDGRGCENQGNPCWLPGWIEDDQNPDEPHEYLCGKHMFVSGYCPGCGLFWGGIESFEFSEYHLCDNCEDEVRAEEEEMDEVYSTYPFDSEDDWHAEQEEGVDG